ncbi:MAG: hypothetical protein OXB88_09150 [Bacteriovoracales bacterium]|nr:hypothetical protein [Bacteriovoracales bacterium]
MLERLQKPLKKAVSQGDWLAQVLMLDLLSKEAFRFYTEIMSLPVPAGLSEEEQNQYMGLLTQQATPYQIQAEEVNKKLEQFWSGPNLVERWQTFYEASTPSVREKLSEEIKIVSAVAPEALKGSFLNILEYKQAPEVRPDRKEVESLRLMVKKEPLNIDLLRKLLDLERKFGQTTMVSYLEGRIQQLEKMSKEGLL